MMRAAVTYAVACVACLAACKASPPDAQTTTIVPTDAAAPTESDGAVADAGPPGLPVANLTVVAHHEDFHDAWLVGDKLVLIGCHRLRVLDGDLHVGHDLAAPAVSAATPACTNLVMGVAGNALITVGTPLHAVDITTGVASVYKRSPLMPQYPSGFYTAVKGVVRFESHRPSPTGYDSFAFAPTADAIYVFGHNGVLRAADPTTGDVRWEYGIGLEPSANRPPIVWTRKDDVVLVSPSKTASGRDAVLLFERTNVPEPLWQATVSGTVVDPAPTADFPGPDHYTVFVGDEVVTTTDGGAFTANASARGLLRVSVADFAPGREVPPQNLAHERASDAGSYRLELKVRHDERGAR